MRHNGNEYHLITRLHPKSPVSEAYRSVRTNLQFTGLNSDLRCILFTSPGPEEGKSTTLANLAVTVAQAGKRVLVMDCDFRKPVQHKIFEAENRRGLTNILVARAEPKEVIVATGVPGLELLPCGPIPPNPSELLDSQPMQEFLPAIREAYDMVLIDAPPVLSVTDAVVLSRRVDGVILVAKAGETRIDVLKETREQLTRASARILGVVLNEVDFSGDGYRYYYYYGAYGSKESRGRESRTAASSAGGSRAGESP